jgi:voltage-gated sodium channel
MTPPKKMLPETRLQRFLEDNRFQHAILVLIVANAAILGLETSASVMSAFGPMLRWIDQALLAVFVVEIALRIYAWRGAFFRDPWSLFDFTVVGIALLPATGPFSVLRALRVLRVLRILTIVPSMRRVVGALLGAMPGLGSIVMVLGLIFYVAAVIATKLFGEGFPDWFGSLGRSLYSLFQIMTLESWSMGIVRPVMVEFPYAWMFFIPFILGATFVMLNLFIAVIVSAMQTYSESEHAHTEAVIADARDHIEDDLHAEMRRLREDIAVLKSALTTRHPPDRSG